VPAGHTESALPLDGEGSGGGKSRYGSLPPFLPRGGGNHGWVIEMRAHKLMHDLTDMRGWSESSGGGSEGAERSQRFPTQITSTAVP
jgi:hypothetical protein